MSLFTSSPTAPGKGGAPNNAILAFVSHEERKRFKTTFEYQRIFTPLITMDMRELIINDVTSERNNRVTAQCQEHGPDRGSSHRGSSHQNGNYDERSYNYPSYPCYSVGYPQYGYNDVSRSYQHYLHSYYPQTGYAASANYPSNWPTLGQASPMSTPARPPYWANCRCIDLPRLPAVSPRTRLWAPGWTRGI